MVETGEGIDWGMAEALAFGTLLAEGKGLTLSDASSFLKLQPISIRKDAVESRDPDPPPMLTQEVPSDCTICAESVIHLKNGRSLVSWTCLVRSQRPAIPL